MKTYLHCRKDDTPAAKASPSCGLSFPRLLDRKHGLVISFFCVMVGGALGKEYGFFVDEPMKSDLMPSLGGHLLGFFVAVLIIGLINWSRTGTFTCESEDSRNS